MGNCARRLTGGGSEETIVSATGPSTTPNVTSDSHTALEECNNLSSLDEVALDNHSGAGSSTEPKSEYFSPRVEEMMRSRSQFTSAVEHEIEHSKEHWSEVRGPSNFSQVSGLSNSSDCDSSEDNTDYEDVNLREYYEKLDRENEEVFEELMNDPQWKHPERGDFFWKVPPLPKSGPLAGPMLGRKIGAGGQADIFELTDSAGNAYPEFIVKVFKRGFRLSELRNQWPCGILRREVFSIISYGWMLGDKRFAFVMARCWGDLSKLIGQAMQEKNNQGPPFPCEWSGRTLHAKDIIRRIAYFMDMLHEQDIIHGDLKASNILLLGNDKGFSAIVADFECSIGTFGTTFWRAPEVLLAMKDRSEIDYSKKIDVYSFGMTCFEIVTGRLPFEGELEVGRASFDLVIEGRRPKLPSDLDVTLKALIERCWNPIPNERPSFPEIIKIIES